MNSFFQIEKIFFHEILIIPNKNLLRLDRLKSVERNRRYSCLKIEIFVKIGLS